MSRTPGSGRCTLISSRATGGASSSGSTQPEEESVYDDRGSGASKQVPAPSLRRRIEPRSNTSMEWDYAPASRTATKLNRLYFNGTKAKGGVPSTGIELFDHTHKKRRSGTDNTSSESGEYVTSRCSRVAGWYRTGEDPANHPPLDKQLWHELTGGTKKGRSFGFGYHPDPNEILGGSSSSGGVSSSSQQQIVENLMIQVQELKQRDEERRAEEARRREEEARREEIRRLEEERFRKQYEEMCELVKILRQNAPRPPP